MILHGDSLEVLKTLDANSVDSVCTDPPYGLSFMGKRWDYDVPSVELWREVLRVLKPGGHLLSFGGTRTYHRMVVNIEDAGFEIRDQIQWLYASGFPKSLDVSKAIDKSAGAEREVIGKADRKNGATGFASGDCVPNITAPATPEAQRWQGWGTALKPANEPIVLARKPLEKGLTVAQNVLKWGTGALNVDSSRIEGKPRTTHAGGNFQSKSVDANLYQHGLKAGVKLSEPQGRWPANLILDEAAAAVLDEQSGVGASRYFFIARCDNSAILNKCELQRQSFSSGAKMDESASSQSIDGFGSRLTGLFRPDTISITKTKTGSTISFQILNASTLTSIGTCTLESERTIKQSEALSIVSVSVAENTESSICLQSGEQVPIKATVALAPNAISQTGAPRIETIGTNTTATGAAARATNTTKSTSKRTATASMLAAASDTENEKPVFSRFLYQAKASKRERNAGLEGMPDVMNKSTSTHGNGQGKTRMANQHERSQGLTAIEMQNTKNNHPTVKPIKLMEYLCRMVTPPSGLVLDPFAGSGSTGVAAKRLGFGFVGIEREAEYVAIATKRVESA